MKKFYLMITSVLLFFNDFPFYFGKRTEGEMAITLFVPSISNVSKMKDTLLRSRRRCMRHRHRAHYLFTIGQMEESSVFFLAK